jgi:hypothetical protein
VDKAGARWWGEGEKKEQKRDAIVWFQAFNEIDAQV